MQPCLNQSVDLDQLAKDINNIHRQTLLRINKNDFTHLLQLERWGRLCTIFGYATAWIAPNPVSALLISQGIFTRWSQLTHPISHGAYDKITNVPNRYKRKGYAKGWHSFVVIIPNHAGDDIPLFNNRPKKQGEFYLRQIIGSVNYPSNSNLNDFFYGWLNYQIEHHLWPDIPLSQYHLVQTPLQQICKKHKINYCQESVFLRLKKAINIMVGTTSMLKETPQLKQQTLK